jgi:signal transduction histidine kinase
VPSTSGARSSILARPPRPARFASAAVNAFATEFALNIRTRLLLLVLVVWLPAVGSFWLLARTTYLRESENLRLHVAQLAQELNSLVERELDKRAVMARMLAASQSLHANDLASFYEVARVGTQGTQSWAILVDAKSQFLNTLTPFSGNAIPRAPGAPFLTAGQTVFFTMRGPVVKAPVACVQMPELRAVPPTRNVGVCFDPNLIQQMYDQTLFPRDSFGGVVDSNGLVIARSKDAQNWLGKPAAPGLLARIDAGQSGFAESRTLEGISSEVYLTKPNRYGWRTSIAMPLSGFQTAAWRVILQAFWASGSLLVIGLALAVYAARRISGPVAALRVAAEKLSQDAVPSKLFTGVQEADEVSIALHNAGLRSQEATATLERRVAQAVQEAREAQAALLEGQKHEAIGRLTGGIAHDFNNLLQTIRMGLQVMEMTATAGQRRVLDSSTRATNRAAELIRQMLAFGRAAPLTPQPVDFRDFMLKTQELAGRALGAKIALAALLEPDLPGLFVDPTQLELALLNLVFNSRDAMPAGGNITVSARRAPERRDTPDAPYPFVRIDVVDDGPGMSAEVQARALEPYFTTKPVGAGSGLGLAQVASFVKQSGGELTLDSAPGQGTRVSLFLPGCALPALVPEAARKAEPPAGVAYRILMVEDDLLVSSVVVPALESAGHAVHLCATADEAVTHLSRDANFDVLFTDVVMPGKLTGMDLAHWCQSNLPAMGLVVATGYTTQRADDRVQLLRKPYEMGALQAALRAAVAASARHALT